MNFLHYEFDLNAGDTVEVILENHANVRLMDDANFALYRKGEKHRALGGYAKTSPIHIAAPRAGHWHVVVDLGGFAGTIRATAHVLQGGVMGKQKQLDPFIRRVPLEITPFRKRIPGERELVGDLAGSCNPSAISCP